MCKNSILSDFFLLAAFVGIELPFLFRMGLAVRTITEGESLGKPALADGDPFPSDLNHFRVCLLQTYKTGHIPSVSAVLLKQSSQP